jgi:predicted nuclease of restriction endonuclease-like RecB superfamily
MLTADLVRVRDSGEQLSPRYLKLDGKGRDRMISRAEGLIEIFSAHEGQPRRALDNAIADLVGDGTDHMLTKGLSKLLSDRAEFETVSPVDPGALRDVVFRHAASHHPLVADGDKVHTSRADVLQLAADELEIDVNTIEDNLYGDLSSNQRMTKWRPLGAEALLHRYNVALAQAVLLRATQLRIHLSGGSPAKHRQLFRHLKFFRLMHRVQSVDGGHKIVIDGPASLLKSTSRYGLQMANFLPALILCEQWSLEADVIWGTERNPRQFHLSHKDALVSHYKNRGVYITDEQKAFEAAFKRLGSGWSYTRRTPIVTLGGRDVLVPDLSFKHSDGRKALLEIVGYWRRGWLKSKAELIAAHGPSNMVLVVSDRLCGDLEHVAEELPVAIVPFKGVILPKRVLAALEAVAS